VQFVKELSQGLKPLIVFVSDAALKRRSSTVLLESVTVLESVVVFTVKT
jgi:hypothetical protein